MGDMDDLIARIKARVADPMRASDSNTWARPILPANPPATPADVNAAEAAFGFPIPPVLRRLYTEVANGRWGPDIGFEGIPTPETVPDGNDIVSLYQIFTAPERAIESPEVKWPNGLVILINSHDLEICDFLRPPYPVFRLHVETWDSNRPVSESLVLIAPSLAERLEAWLATGPVV